MGKLPLIVLFTFQLEIGKLKENFRHEEEVLVRMENEINSTIPPSRAKQWQEIAPKIVVLLQEDLSSNEEEEVPEEFQNSEMADNIAEIYRCLQAEKYINAIHLLRFTEKKSNKKKNRCV